MIIREKQALEHFGDFVKVVVDIDRTILAMGCELHVDCAQELEQDGSKPEHLWGANVYPISKEIDFVSLINIRPAVGNRAMEIEKPEIRSQVEAIITNLLFS